MIKPVSPAAKTHPSDENDVVDSAAVDDVVRASLQEKAPDAPDLDAIASGAVASIVVDAELGAVEVQPDPRDTVRLDPEELKRRIAELDQENEDPFGS